MTDTVTLPRSVVEQAIEAMRKSGEQRGSTASEFNAIEALLAALDQPQVEQQTRYLAGGARYKVTHLAFAGYCIHGLPREMLGQWVAFVDATDNKHMDSRQPQSVTYCHQSQPQGEQEPVAWQSIEAMAVQRYKVVPAHDSMFYRHAVVAGDGTQQLYIGRETECENMARKFAGAFLDGAYVALLYTHPQNLRCKSTQARLATLWGYEKPRPTRQPLTDEQIIDIAHEVPVDEISVHEDTWHIRFARAIERAHKIVGTA